MIEKTKTDSSKPEKTSEQNTQITIPPGASCRVYTWGQGKSGELGHASLDKEKVCAFPTVVPCAELIDVVFVACGECSTGAVTRSGSLFMWGSGRGGRLGLGSETSFSTPQHVIALKSKHVTQVSIGENHAVCVVDSGEVFSWGKGNHGCLGNGSTEQHNTPQMALLAKDTPLRGIVAISCGFQSTAAVTPDGKLYTWGDGGHGKLGHSDCKDRMHPTIVESLSKQSVKQACMGSLFAAAVTADGGLYTWGFGGSGNLGHGDRSSLSSPKLVQSLVDRGVRVRAVHCTVGQINPPQFGSTATTGGKTQSQRPEVSKTKQTKSERERKETKTKTKRTEAPKGVAGREGPHCMAVSEDGKLFTWGTCHKGILANMRDKVLVHEGDELIPYEVGGVYRDHADSGKSQYLNGVRVVQCVASSIHSACLDADGRVYSFGCGSDGRMGIRKYMEGLHGGRSRMKCYVSKPTIVEALAEGGVKVLQIGTARRHMVALGYTKST